MVTLNNEKAAANRRLAQWRVMWLMNIRASYQVQCWQTVLCSEIRHCAKRQTVSRNAEKLQLIHIWCIFAS